MAAPERTMVLSVSTLSFLSSFYCNHHCLRLPNSFYFGWCKEKVLDTNEMSETWLQPSLGLAIFSRVQYLNSQYSARISEVSDISVFWKPGNNLCHDKPRLAIPEKKHQNGQNI